MPGAEDPPQSPSLTLLGVPSLKEQKKQIQACELNVEPKEGETWFLLSAKWWKTFKGYVDYDSYDELDGEEEKSEWKEEDKVQGTHPGMIENDFLLAENGMAVHHHMLEMRDFVCVTEQTYKLLQSWYCGGPPIPRQVVMKGYPYREAIIEIFPLYPRVSLKDGVEHTIPCSTEMTVRQFIAKAVETLQLDDSVEWRLLEEPFGAGDEFFVLEMDMESAVRSSDVHLRLVEGSADEGGLPSYENLPPLVESTFTRRVESSSSSDGWAPTYDDDYGGPSTVGTYYSGMYRGGYSNKSTWIGDESPTTPGQTGLDNLGNTCFMASGLQCLVHAHPFVQFFLSGEYRSQINTTNPIGMKGQIARAFSTLVEHLWSGKYSSVQPRDLKQTVSKYAPQFSGYQQQDSHELVAFLLDGLHEDLNRVLSKPATEPVEGGGGRPDAQVAHEAWRRHLLRNRSVVVDLFQGQFRSHVRCPTCSHESLTFDPMMYLAVPLPTRKDCDMDVIFVPFQQPDAPLIHPIKLRLTILKHANIKALRIKMAEVLENVNADHLQVTEVFNNRFYKIYEDRDAVDMISANDVIVVLELPHQDWITVKVRQMYEATGYSYSPLKNIGVPTIMQFPKDTTFEVIEETLWGFAKRNLEHPEHFVSTSSFPPIPSSDEELPPPPAYSPPPLPEGDAPQYAPYWIGTCEDVVYAARAVSPLSRENPMHTMEDKALVIMWDTGVATDKDVFVEYELEDMEDRIGKKEEGGGEGVADALLLEDCLDKFSQEEELGEDDKWYCSQCAEHKQALKSVALWKLPDLLAIHIKRFQYNSYFRDKLDTLLRFPLCGLDMSTYVQEKGDQCQLYDCYAVSNHYGGLGGGHYTAFAYCAKESRWMDFDDSRVSGVEEKDVVSDAAYVLFYRRRKNPPDEQGRVVFQEGADFWLGYEQTIPAEVQCGEIDRKEWELHRQEMMESGWVAPEVAEHMEEDDEEIIEEPKSRAPPITDMGVD